MNVWEMLCFVNMFSSLLIKFLLLLLSFHFLPHTILYIYPKTVWFWKWVCLLTHEVFNRQKTEEIMHTTIVGMIFKHMYTWSFILTSMKSTGTHAVNLCPILPEVWTNTDREVIFIIIAGSYSRLECLTEGAKVHNNHQNFGIQ